MRGEHVGKVRVMRYNELRIEVDKRDLEVLTALLIENGQESMMIDDPSDEADIIAHPDIYKYDYINEELGRDSDRRPVVTLYFEDNEQGRDELGAVVSVLRECSLQLEKSSRGSESETGSGGPDIKIVPAGDDSEWLYKWQEYFKPAKVGERIVVKPSWEEYTPSEDDLVIEMDPGMAFGSGLHETTSMCIKALEKILPGHRCAVNRGSADGEDTGDKHKALRVLDVGTGTGILAIAAALLGADECLGIDIDTDAVRVAESNVEHNGLSDQIKVQYGDLTEGVDYMADIVVANLMADLVIRLSPAAGRHLSRGGWYITSGILDIKEKIVCEAIEAAGFEIRDVLHDGELCAVVAVKM